MLALRATAISVASASLVAACTLVADLNGLTGGSPNDAGDDATLAEDAASGGADAEIDGGVESGVDGGPAPLFAEDFEDGAARWTPVPTLDYEPCSTTFQRETILATGGRVKLVMPLPVSAGANYCLVAWIRGSAATQPFIGVAVGMQHHWLIGHVGYDNDYDGAAIPVASDGLWHSYSAPFVVEDGGATLVIMDELFEAGSPGTADFDDIRLYAETCPSQPAGDAHDCP
jgi:hypothetical protein